MASNNKDYEKNLEKGKATQFKSGEEAANAGHKGGVASGEAKRAKKSMAQIAKIIADSPTNDKNKAVLEALGVEEGDATNNAVVVASVFKGATKGNVKAVHEWEKLVDIVAANDKPYKLPAEMIGRAFVDINRDIQPNMEYVFEGGRGSLKSSYISFKIIELIKNNPNMHACITRQVGNTLKDSVYARMKWAINLLGLSDEFECKTSPLEIRYKKTSQVIYFRGLDDELKLKSITPEFGYIGILWKEEKDQMKGEAQERSVNQSVLRGGSESYDFSSYNPPKSTAAWVNRAKLEPNTRRVIHTSNFLEAPPEWLGEKFLNDAEHLKEVNPTAFEHEYMGIPCSDGGNVFEFLETRDITDEEFEKFDRIMCGVDFGWYPDQYCYLRTHYDSARERIYLMDELYVNKWSNAKTGEWILENGYDDFPFICDSAEPKSINDYRDMGLPARGAIKGAGSIEYGFKFLQTKTIVIDPTRTPNAYQEIINYEYARDKDGNVVSGYPDGNDHAISALRYAYEPIFNARGYSA